MMREDIDQNEWERLMLAFGDAVLRIATRHDDEGNPIHKIVWTCNGIQWEAEPNTPYLPLMEATRQAFQAYEDARKVGLLKDA